jgi:DNA-binding XRE family transcriptional regulator
MLALTKKHHTKLRHNIISIRHGGILYIFPKKIADKYRVHGDSTTIDASKAFEKINKKYSKPGSLLRGIRIRENLTQVDMAKKIKVTQSDVSQMENGTRNIGRVIAKRIAKLFKVDYRSFLE